MAMERRSLLKQAALLPLLGASPSRAEEPKPDYTVRIATGLVELAPDHIVSTTLYNGCLLYTSSCIQEFFLPP